MRLTQKSKYGARAMLEIALIGRGPPGAAEIARRRSIPERFLEQFFEELRRGGILDEARVGLEGVFSRYSIAQLAEAERGSPDRRVTRGPPLLHPL